MSSPKRKLKRVKQRVPRLSLCMMVRNEAETLEQCLRLARPHVDEVVVVDTGSTDGTQDIARRYADVYEEIVWPGSFSEARNHTFDLATGDYILVLDGDEYVPEQADWDKLKKRVAGPVFAAAQLRVRNLLAEGQIISADCMWQERIFPNDPQLRYTGRVHHQIQDNLLAYMKRTGHELTRIHAEIVHTGYALASERMAEKYEPRIALLEAEYAGAASARYRAYYGYQLAVVHYVLGQYEAAARIFNALGYSFLSPQNAFYTRMLAAQTGLKLGNVPMALVHCNEMLTLDPGEPMGFYTTGLALLMGKQVGNGLLMLLEAYNINDEAERKVRFILNDQQLLKTLANVCTQVGLAKQAGAFQALYEDGEARPEAVKALIASMKLSIVRAEQAHAHAEC
jgi:glycosyltransferase involved in cell wall biosynthesis